MSTTPVLSLSQRNAPSHRQWEQAIRAAGRQMRVAIPGIIQDFNIYGDQTCTVQVALNEEIVLPDGTLQKVPIAPLVHVPLVLPRAGGFSLTLPVQAGDECLVVFGDMCIDGWWQAGGVQNQVEIRRHDLSDGFAILGPWSQPRKLANYSTESAQLRSDDGQTVIDVSAGRVAITATTVEVTAQNANVNASGQAQVVGNTVAVVGSQSVNISGNGQTVIDGVNFLEHSHSGVSAGAGVSGPVVP